MYPLKDFAVLSLFVIALFNSSTVFSATPLEFSRDKIQIDGQLTEAVWQQATRIDVNVEVSPANNKAAEVTTTAYIYENGETIFIGIEALDNNPELIRAEYKKRDNINNDDRIAVTIDTFNTLRRAFRFEMNPYGVQSDEIFNEHSGSNKSWNTLWQGAGKKNDKGYSLEFQIPFSSLRFPITDEGQVWRIEIERYMPRGSTIHIASSPKERGNNCFLCQVPEYQGVCNIVSNTDLQLVPTLLMSRNSSRDEEQLIHDNPEYEAGFDMKWGITPDNVLNLTINPDFSQVESDDSQITVNKTFSPSFSEKRPFFLEGSSFFNTAKSNLVHTRNIVAPEYGVKLTGQTGNNNYAVLAAKDEVASFILPSLTGSEALTLLDEQEQNIKSDNLIVRYNRNFKGLSNMGMLMTHKSSRGYQNDLFTVDGNFQPDLSHKISYEVSHTKTKNSEYLQTNYGQQANQSGSSLNMQYDFNQANYRLSAKYVNYDKDYRADLSKQGRVGHNYKRFSGGYDWFGGKGSEWTKWGVYSDWDQTYENGGVKLRQEFESHYFIQGPMQLWWKNGFKDRSTYWEGNYYDEFWIDYHFAIDPIDSVRVRWLLTEGEKLDYSNNRIADYKQLTYGADWRAFEHFTGTFKLVFQDMSVAQGTIYQVDQLDVRATWQFNLAHSLKVVTKYSHIERDQTLYIDDVDSKRTDISSQIVYSWAPTPITVLHAGFSNNSFNDEFVDSLKTDNQSVFLKLSYGFQL